MEQTTWTPQTPALDLTMFSVLLTRQPVVVLHFWAVWDGYDRDVDATLQQVIPLFSDRIVFFSVNIDDEANWEICRQCSVMNLPALGCYVQGQFHEVSIGVLSSSQLRTKLESWSSADEIAP